MTRVGSAIDGIQRGLHGIDEGTGEDAEAAFASLEREFGIVEQEGVKGQELLSNDGVNESLQDVFQNWRAAIPDQTTDGGIGPCADVLAVYMALRTNG